MYQKKLEQTFIVYDLTDDVKKKALLLTSLGSSMWNLLWDLCSPDDPTDDDISYDDICAVLSAHFVPDKIEIAERFRFYQRKQQPGESVATFIAALRNLSKDCAFGAFLQQALRDAFVIGLLNPKIQTALLADKNLTLDSALTLATSMEAAALKTRELRQTPISNIHAFPEARWAAGVAARDTVLTRANTRIWSVSAVRRKVTWRRSVGRNRTERLAVKASQEEGSAIRRKGR